MATVEHYRQAGGWSASTPLELPLEGAIWGGFIVVTFDTIGETITDVGSNWQVNFSVGAIDSVTGSVYKRPTQIFTAYTLDDVGGPLSGYTIDGAVAEFGYYPQHPKMWIDTNFQPIGNGPNNLIVNVWIVNCPA